MTDQPTADAIDDPDLVLGIMRFGTATDEQTAFTLLDAYLDAGGVWLDTADCYSYWADPEGRSGQSEAVLGRWLSARPGARDRIRIATKVGCVPVPRSVNPAGTEGLSAEVIEAGITGSLARMRTDHVDLYWAHRDDLAVPQEETVGSFLGLIADGRISRWGYSNAALWRFERARGIALSAGGTPPTAMQLRYSYLQPRPFVRDHIHDHRYGWVTDETLNYASCNPGTGIWAYSSLLNGAYDRSDKPINAAYDHPGNTRRLAVLERLAKELGLSRTELVIAWMSNSRPKVAPIAGVSTLEQLEEALRGSRLRLPEDVMAQLDEPW
ncbi:oxidoreductase [Microlunatus endophyticus]|uniref:Oxidoreductase n=1 Tax=Microlunatus endophyticus TaxID=1716077 RepID=A0A917SCT5_9ACTN|nr:aldo/keto reductase [Microlunatus endophyticus]GGL72920.1 oxidoreductase [Microlunatus endophyticus]